MMKAFGNCISVPLISRIVNRVVGIMLPVMGLPDADVVALWRSRLALMSRAASVSELMRCSWMKKKFRFSLDADC